jgi:hypothetical protein
LVAVVANDVERAKHEFSVASSFTAPTPPLLELGEELRRLKEVKSVIAFLQALLRQQPNETKVAYWLDALSRGEDIQLQW